MDESFGGIASAQGASPYYGESQLNSAKAIQMPTIKQRCEMAVKQAEERLARVKEARELLDRNPDLERLLDIMQQSHF